MPDSNGLLTTQERSDILDWWHNMINNSPALCPWDNTVLEVDDHIYEAISYPMTPLAATGVGLEAMFAMECPTCGYHSFHSFDPVISNNIISEFRT